MKLPSKELLSEALGLEVTYLSDELDGVMLPYQVARKEGWNTINIYELMHLMIMWALSLNYSLKSVYINASEDDEEDDVYCDLVVTVYKTDGEYMVFHTQEPTAFEAVTEACEWVLEQKYP